ncbi:MAG: ABC transporter permease [Spirochaetaceae bacterium]|jgi:peptide/nickel transport system permease protein|nr:ABC transporter permease [Spirochaetaceae bacterium]
MKRFIVKRLLGLVPVLFILSVIVFAFIHLIPGDPARVMLGDKVTEVEVEALRESMHLNDSIPVQYIKWISGVLRGNFGASIFINENMLSLIGNHLAPTLLLTAYSMVFAILVAIPLGITAAYRRGSALDLSIEGFAMAGISIPSFLLGLVLTIVFSVKLRIFPASGYRTIGEAGVLGNLRYLALPAIALGSMQAGLLIRMTRSSVLEVLYSDYIRMVRAKGMDEITVIAKHALRNALLPIMTTAGQMMMALLSGAAVIESVFNVPGVGQLIINSVTRRDYEVIQAIILLIAVINIVVCFFIDLLYGIVDPRVRLENH